MCQLKIRIGWTLEPIITLNNHRRPCMAEEETKEGRNVTHSPLVDLCLPIRLYYKKILK
jgi:hypothetical protein